MSSILIFFFTGCLKITQTLKVTNVKIKSFCNNSLVTDNSLYRLSSRNSQAFFKSALTGLAGSRCGNVLFSPLPSIPLNNDK